MNGYKNTLAYFYRVGYIRGMIHTTDSEIILVEPSFGIGDIVVHTLYHFRAVVVDVDSHFDEHTFTFVAGDEAVHMAPDQPWYKLLIDDGDDLSYAPESVLCADYSAEPIRHPMLENYLVANKGRYVSTTMRH